MALTELSRHLCELDSLITKQWMTKQAYLQQDGMFMKITRARENTLHERISYNNLGKIEYHVNILPGTFYSKSRARLKHTRALHNYKQGNVWIEHNYIYKTSLLNIIKKSMDLTVATWIHGNKITSGKRLQKSKPLKTETSRSLVCMLVLSTTQITQIHGIHLYKDGMAWIKTPVELMPIRCTHQMQQK